MHNQRELSPIRSRRGFLQQTAGGLGAIALMHLLKADDIRGLKKAPAVQPHFVPRAKNVIFLFMAGAPSQLDLLDPKHNMTKP
jgi:hypothetical protein